MRRARTKLGAAFLGALCAVLWCPRPVGAAPAIEAKGAVLMDAGTGTVLFGKEMHQPRPMASTTKIMTALVALEADRLDDTVTISTRAVQVSGSSLHLKEGDVVEMDELLAALLLESANDAAVAIAEHLGGTVEAFADEMNQRARQLGCKHTHFVNPHGLHDPEHYASACDLAVITRKAMEYSRFRELVRGKSAEIALPGTTDGPRTLVNHNRLLWRESSVDGVKTGYVKESGRCLVASATRGGWQLIVVVLDSPDPYEEGLRLLDYGFSGYGREVYARAGDALGRVRVRGSLRRSVPAICERTLAIVSGLGVPSVPARLEVKLKSLTAPVSRGDVAGEARLTGGGRTLARSALVAGESAPRSTLAIALIWVMRAGVLALLIVLLARTYGKAVKGHRGGGGGIPPEGGRAGPRRPRPG